MRKTGSDRDQVTANGTSTQSKEIDPQWRAPPAVSGVYRIQSGSPSQYTKEGSDKRFRDRSLNVRRFPTHYLLQTHNTRASNDRQRRRPGRAQRPRCIVSILPGMRKRRKGPLTTSSWTPIRDVVQPRWLRPLDFSKNPSHLKRDFSNFSFRHGWHKRVIWLSMLLGYRWIFLPHT